MENTSSSVPTIQLNIAQQFVSQMPTMTDQQFVDYLYLHGLGRSSSQGGDSGGTYWVQQLTNHQMTRAQVDVAIANSNEMWSYNQWATGVNPSNGVNNYDNIYSVASMISHYTWG